MQHFSWFIWDLSDKFESVKKNICTQVCDTSFLSAHQTGHNLGVRINYFYTWEFNAEGNLSLVTKDFWFLSNQFHHLQYHIQSHYLDHLDPFLWYLLQIKAIWSWLLSTFGSLATSSITLDMIDWFVNHWESWESLRIAPKMISDWFTNHQGSLRITENHQESLRIAPKMISDWFANHQESLRIIRNH